MGVKPGFTLIELLIVTAIVGVLAAIAVPNFLNARLRALAARAAADMDACAKALEQYAADYGSYPLYGNPLDEVSALSGASMTYLPVSLTTPVAYLTALPVDPFVPRALEGSDAADREGPYKYLHGYDQIYKNQQFIGSHIRIHFENFSGGRANLLWQVWSMGPDRVPSHTGLQYRPSNGLFSAGDISRFGP